MILVLVRLGGGVTGELLGDGVTGERLNGEVEVSEELEDKRDEGGVFQAGVLADLGVCDEVAC